MSSSETGRFRFEDRMPPMRVPLQRRSISPKPDRKFFLPCFLLFFCCPRAARSPAGGPPGLYGCLGAMIRPMCDLRQGRPAVFFEPTAGGGTPPASQRYGPQHKREAPTVARDAMDDASPASSGGPPPCGRFQPPTPPCRGRGGSRSGPSGCRSGQAPSSPVASQGAPGASAVGGRPTGRRSC